MEICFIGKHHGRLKQLLQLQEFDISVFAANNISAPCAEKKMGRNTITLQINVNITLK